MHKWIFLGIQLKYLVLLLAIFLLILDSFLYLQTIIDYEYMSCCSSFSLDTNISSELRYLTLKALFSVSKLLVQESTDESLVFCFALFLVACWENDSVEQMLLWLQCF